MDPIIIGGIIALVVVVGGGAFFFLSRRSGGVVDQRLESLNEIGGDFGDFEVEGEEEQNLSVLDESRRLLDPFNEFLSQRQFGKDVRQRLARANLRLTVAEYAVSHIFSAAAGFTIAYLLLFPGQFTTATIVGAVGLFVPRIYVGRKINGRLNQFETQLPDTLGLWVNALRSGYSVLQAIEAISRDSPEPTMSEFDRVVREVQLGIDLEDALAHLLERIESEDLDLVITAVNIQREVGGNLAEILEVISHTIRERIKLKGEIRVLTSQGRMTGYVISFLPIALAGFLQVTSEGYMGRMFENRTCGWPMIGVGLALIGIGTALIQKITDIEI